MVFSRYIIPIGILILIIYICNSDHKEYFSNDSGIGQTGKNGYLGYTGQIGEKGILGSSGEKGFAGPIGDMGEIGKRGPNGKAGRRGDYGVHMLNDKSVESHPINGGTLFKGKIDIMKGNEMIVVSNSEREPVHVNEFDSDGMKISNSIFINNGNDKIIEIKDDTKNDTGTLEKGSMNIKGFISSKNFIDYDNNRIEYWDANHNGILTNNDIIIGKNRFNAMNPMQTKPAIIINGPILSSGITSAGKESNRSSRQTPYIDKIRSIDVVSNTPLKGQTCLKSGCITISDAPSKKYSSEGTEPGSTRIYAYDPMDAISHMWESIKELDNKVSK